MSHNDAHLIMIAAVTLALSTLAGASMAPVGPPLTCDAAAASRQSHESRQQLSAAMRAVIGPLVGTAVRTVSGTCPEEGVFVLVTAPVDPDHAQGAIAARLQAQAAVASFLGLSVESQVGSEMVSSTTAEGTQARTAFCTATSAETSAVLNGVELLSLAGVEGRQYFIFGMTEAGISRAATLRSLAARAWASLPGSTADAANAADAASVAPSSGENERASKGRVRATGFARIEDDDLQGAIEKATTNAKRQAVEQARGALVLGRTSWQALEGEVSGADHVLSLSSGQINSLEILSAGPAEVEGWVEVRVLAKVREVDYEQCLEEYLSVVSPATFYVTPSREPSTPVSQQADRTVRHALSRLGVTVTSDRAQADFLVTPQVELHEVKHPVNGRPITRLNAALAIKYAASGRVAISFSPASPISSGITDRLLRKEDCLDKLDQSLRRGLAGEIGELVEGFERSGRPVTVSLRTHPGTNARTVFADLRQQAQQIPGVKVTDPKWSDRAMTLDVRTFLGPTELDRALRSLITNTLRIASEGDSPKTVRASRIDGSRGGRFHLDYHLR